MIRFFFEEAPLAMKAALLLLLGVFIYIIFSILTDPSFIKEMSTPLKDVSLGKLLFYIVMIVAVLRPTSND